MSPNHRLSILGISIACAGAVLLPANAARADKRTCATSQGMWNVPAGALVVNRSSGMGPVGTIMSAIGERWVHAALSHGGSSGASMTTMQDPKHYPDGNSGCRKPIDSIDLASGAPGPRRDNMGALWAFYFNGNKAFMNGEAEMKYIVPGTGSNYYNGGVISAPDTDYGVAACTQSWTQRSMANCTGGDYCQLTANSGTTSSGRTTLGYSVYSYMKFDLGNGPTTTSSGYGTMCSGLLARSYYWGSRTDGTYCTPNAISQYTYSNTKVYAAANALYSVIRNGDAQSWTESLGTSVWCDDPDLRNEAADQAINCFAYPQKDYCNKTGHDWYSNHVSNLTATSVSPDRLAGEGGAIRVR